MTNDAVQITTGLKLLTVSDPEIGGGPSTATTGYTDGDVVKDISTLINADHSEGGQLVWTAPTGNFLVRVVNGSTANPLFVSVGGTDMGYIPAGASALIPLITGLTLNLGVNLGTTVTAGVTIIKWTANA